MGTAQQLATTLITLYVLSVIAVATRCYVRTKIVKEFKYDDWWMLATLGVFTCYTSFVICGVHYGTGRHNADLPPENVRMAMFYWYLCEITYILTTTCIKVAIGCLLMRIAVLPAHVRALQIVFAASGIFGFFYVFFGIFQCWPVAKFWNPTQNGWCFSGTQIAISSYVHSTISASADWFFAILPIFMVRKSNMPMRMKVMVVGILGIGSVGSLASLVRYKYIDGFETDDFLYTTTDLAIWSTIEVGLGIIAGSMGTFRPLLRTRLPTSKVTVSGETGGSGSNSFGLSETRLRGESI